MSQYNMTDKEQAEMIKRWWNDYGKAIVFSIVIGLVIAFGWRYWRSHQIEVRQAASSLYMQLNEAASAQDLVQAKRLAQTLMEKYSATPYATMGALWWAKELVVENNFSESANKLNWVIDHSRVASFKQITRIRLSRLQIDDAKNTEALATLAKIEDKSFMPLIYEARGDVYTAMKDYQRAAQSYKKANEAGNTSPVLLMKLASINAK